MAAIIFSIIGPATAVSNGTESVITTGTTNIREDSPAIDGDHVVWVRNVLWGVLDQLDLTSGELIELPITDSNLFSPNQPSVFQGTVVWNEYDGLGAARIVRYNISGATIQGYYDAAYDFTAPEYTFPKIHGNTTVWQNYNTTNLDWDIAIARDGATAPELILASANNEKHPSVYGDFVVFENWTDPSHVFIWQFNLTDNSSAPVASLSDQETNPRISGGRIVWQARNITDTVSSVNVRENGTITRLTPEGVNQEKPAINGDRIVVEDYRRHSGIPDIYLYQYSSGWNEIWVAPNTFSASQITPAIWNDRFVWEDTRSGNACGGCDSDIYLFTLGSSDSCPVADFSLSANAGADPLTVTFTDNSSGSPILYRSWNYSDSTTSYPLDPAGQTFSGTGIYHPRLTVGNTKCRNVTTAAAKYDIYIDTPPDADFTAIPLEGFAPLSVRFTDISGGDPASWTWDFGDGSISHEQNPRHTFATEGQTYTVTLTVNNTFAAMAPDSETKSGYVRTFLGATGLATTPVEGITVISRHGGWFLLYNATMLPDIATPGPSILTAFHPGSSGWQNITFIADDGVGFADTYGNSTFMGNLTQAIFQTEDVIASGTSPSIGTGWGVSYRLNTSRYPSPSSISTQIWENATVADQEKFRLIAIGSNFIPNNSAYTALITRSGFSGNGNATINMSLDRAWLGGQEANTYIIGYGVNSDGNTVGSVTPARYLSDDGTLDYFEAEVPEYFTTFGIVPLSGSGNPFQLITLSVTSHVNPPAQDNPSAGTDSGMPSGGGAAAAQAAISTAAPTPGPTQAPPDPGRSAKVYTNANGVVTQATQLQSTDGRATIVLGEGVVAKDDTGNPLAGISMMGLPAENLPPVPTGSTVNFAGMAYDIGPDGATFSPSLTLTFTLPQAEWGQDYSVKLFDTGSGTWVDLPMTFDAATGTVSVPVSHLCCVALFTEPRAAPPAPASTPRPLPAAPQAKAQPPTTAVNIFVNMMGWAAEMLVNNILVLVVIIGLVVAAVMEWQGRFPGFGR